MNPQLVCTNVRAAFKGPSVAITTDKLSIVQIT
jgi:hypothetical protein